MKSVINRSRNYRRLNVNIRMIKSDSEKVELNEKEEKKIEKYIYIYIRENNENV